VKVNDLLRIGVLAVQGNFREHGAMLRRLGVDSIEVRRAEQLEGLDGLGTCAGMILFARDHLGLLDVEVERNAYGRQVASFEADVTIEGENEPLPGVFIRAPRIVETGAAVEVLGRLAGEAVLVREGRILAASFHPELTDDTRVHERFLQVVGERREVSVVGP
jgi:5'-phosphate synthase pdxT subunit